MKKIAPVMLVGFLLAPGLASAQGYPGLMSPQQGYQAPRAPVESPVETQPAADDAQDGAPRAAGAPVGALPGSALPYGGTGADTHAGHVTVSSPGAAAQGEAGEEAAAGNAAADNNSDGPAPQAGYAGSFAPKEKPWVDPHQSKNLYDFVQAAAPANRMDAPARRAQSQADAALQAQRDETERANAERMRQQNEAIRASADQIQDNLRKKQEDAEDGMDSSQDPAP